MAFDYIQNVVVNGTYSVDKPLRLARGYNWFESEQLTNAEKENILQLVKKNQKIDYVLSHAGPSTLELVHLFIPQLNQDTVDKSTPIFLQKVLNEIDTDYLKGWYFGHYHAGEKINDKTILLYKRILKLGDTDL